MANAQYIGVGGVARKVKKICCGVLSDIPIYTEQVKTVAITASNIADYFDVENSSYYFAGSGSIFTSNNGGQDGSTAKTILTAKYDISALSFKYSWSSENNYDKFTLKVGGTTVENAVSGSTTNKSYSGSLSKGQTIEFIYTKDSSQSGNEERGTVSNMSITATVRVQSGVETKAVARNIKSGYVGIGGVARQFLQGGILASDLLVENTVKINENGVPVEYIVVHSGLPSSIYDSSCNGLWLLRKEIPENMRMDVGYTGTKGMYEYSEVDEYLNGTWMDRYDSNVLSAISQVKIPYRAEGTLGTTKTGADGLSRKVFLLSAVEIGFVTGNNGIDMPDDGVKLDYFISGISEDAIAKRMTNINESYNGNDFCNWWTRSAPLYLNENGSIIATSNGTPQQGTSSGEWGVRPALIVPFNALFEPGTMILKGIA